MKSSVTHYLKFARLVTLLGIILPCNLTSAAPVATGVSSTTSNESTIVSAVSASDLGTAATVTGANGAFGTAAELTNGVITPGSGSLYLPETYGSAAKLPEIYTIALDVVSHPQGYDISSIRTFAGWTANGPQLANQKYTISISKVATPTSFVSLGTFEYIPFNDNAATGGGISQVTVADDAGALLGTGVHSVRVEFLNHNFSGPDIAVDGTVYYETDIIGYATGTTPADLTINSPTTRQIIQRGAQNTASITVQGTLINEPDSVEARAVVMAEAGNSGTTTAWQTIDATPTGGSFSGTLTNVAAGGWYQIEVRSVVSGTPGNAQVVQKVGVGDIYVTAGQSNSANHGQGGFTATDDRVSMRTTVTGNNWIHAKDPAPIATGPGGGVWTRLGGLLAAADDIPIGFIAVGVGGTQVVQWVPGTSYYNNRLRPAVQSFPANGFRAVLWHQGESDSIANVTAATHAARLASMISQSRTDAGWNMPWYVAEASFIPNTKLTQEEPVVAGQRQAVFADPLTYLGPSTDEFHLEDANGGKLADGVHFNNAGLMDHAQQWRDILRNTAELTPRNGNFEENSNPGITGLTALADGGVHLVAATTDDDSPSVLGWRILSASGITAADGSNGFHNPAAGTYAAAVDTANNGELPHMAGRHVAMLDGGSAGNYFLHTTRVLAKPNTTYNLIVALGVRDSAASFGGAKLEILANGAVVATASFDKSAIDALHGSDSSGSFTDVSVNWTTAAAIDSNQALAIRIVKEGGAGTVIDFDNVRFSTATGYGLYRIQHWGDTTSPDSAFDRDADQDQIPNGIEYFLGYDPNVANPLPKVEITETAGVEWSRFVVPLDPSVTDTGLELQYSFDLVNWKLAASSGDGSIVNTKLADSWKLEVNTTAHAPVFFRLYLNEITSNP